MYRPAWPSLPLGRIGDPVVVYLRYGCRKSTRPGWSPAFRPWIKRQSGRVKGLKAGLQQRVWCNRKEWYNQKPLGATGKRSLPVAGNRAALADCACQCHPDLRPQLRAESFGTRDHYGIANLIGFGTRKRARRPAQCE